MKKDDATVFVTAANGPFWRCLFQLLKAAHRQGWTNHGAWIAYDMGLDAAHRTLLETRFPWCEFRDLDFKAYSDHYRPEAGNFTWKPLILWQVVQERSGPVVWMDSANLPKTSPQPLIDHIQAHGFYILRGQAALQDRCEPAVLEALGAPKWTWGTREGVACFIGMNAGDPVARGIIKRWWELTKTPDVFDPKTRTIPHHMHDQAVLNALLLPRACAGEITLPQIDIDISACAPVRYLSTRNKLRPTVPVWADGLARAYYRIRKWIYERLDCLEQWALASSTVRLLRGECHHIQSLDHATGTKQDLGAGRPVGLVQHGRKSWLFYTTGGVFGRAKKLMVRPLDAGAQKILAFDAPTATPYVFQHEDRVLMVVNNGADARVELWECEQFPSNWVMRQTIVSDVDARDPVIFHNSGHFWLIASLKSPVSAARYRALALFSSPELGAPQWKPHPSNDQGLYISSNQQEGRNAGGVLLQQGQFLRRVKSTKGIGYCEITQLTETTFEEALISQPSNPDQTNTLTAEFSNPNYQILGITKKPSLDLDN